MKPSRATKSAAYKFAKSLMADGATGADVHNLISAINDNISADIGGSVLMDLLKNPKDENADVELRSSWFGPFNVTFYHWIAEDWANYCKDTELRGYFRFGADKDWEEWNNSSSEKLTQKELKEVSAKAVDQIIIFEWYSDAVQDVEIRKFINKLYKTLSARAEKERKEKK